MLTKIRVYWSNYSLNLQVKQLEALQQHAAFELGRINIYQLVYRTNKTTHSFCLLSTKVQKPMDNSKLSFN